MEKSNKKRSIGGIISFITILILILAVVFIASRPNYGSEIEMIPEFQELVNSGEVSDVYAEGGRALVRLKESEISDNDWSRHRKADCYVMYTSSTDIKDIITEYNNTVDAAAKVSYVNHPASESLISTIAPYISIIIMIALAVMFWRMLKKATNAGGTNNFGKSTAQVERSSIRFSDIAGADEEKEETAEIVEFLKNPQKFRAVGARIPKGVLLVGPPGTGKTLLAKAVAGESNVPFFSMSGSDFVELYVGVGASRVRDLFSTAQQHAPCIIFIDEIDAVGRRRGSGLGGGHDEREQTLNQLLVEMDGFNNNTGIIVMAATNRADILDPALLRPGRFDRQIHVNVPDVKGREGILKIHARGKPIDKSVDFGAIARLTSGMTGADIENFLNEAAILTARDGRSTITMADITEGINKATMGPQKRSNLVTEEDKKRTAYHESGHAILIKSLNTGETVHEVSIIPRGQAGGYTSMRTSKDTSYYTKDVLLNKICGAMGGRIAEEIVFGELSTGAANDIKQATQIAHYMVVEYGMSDLGFVNYGEDAEIFVGRDYQKKTSYSEETAAKIDEQVQKILSECYAKSKKLLESKRDIMDNMVKLLLEKETIYSDEIDMIISGKDPKDVSKHIEKRAKAEKRRNDKLRKVQEVEQAKKLQEIKLQAATALNKAGILSKSELDLIKSEIDKTETALPAAPKKRGRPRKNPLTSTDSKESSASKDSTTKSAAPKSTSTKAKTASKPKTAKKSATKEKQEKKSEKKDNSTKDSK